MTETQRVFKWFWAWNDEEEEQWLTDMAKQGWHLQSSGVVGFYTFERGDPRDVVYRLDFKTAGKDKEEYVQLFVDAGWEHVDEMGGWQYFRKVVDGEDRPEIYTDQASKVYKYQRLLLFLIIFLPIYSTLFTNISQSSSDFVQAVSVVAAFFMLLYVYAMIRIFMRVQGLKK